MMCVWHVVQVTHTRNGSWIWHSDKCASWYILVIKPTRWFYLLTPRCRVLLEKLTGLQLVKKCTAFHGTRRFITALTSVRHLSLSWASPIQSTYPHPNSWRSILILSTHLRLGLPSGKSRKFFSLPLIKVSEYRAGFCWENCVPLSRWLLAG